MFDYDCIEAKPTVIQFFDFVGILSRILAKSRISPVFFNISKVNSTFFLHIG